MPVKPQIADIVERSLPLEYFLNCPSQNPSSDDEPHKRLEHWCQVVAQGDWTRFQRRLEWDDLTTDEVQKKLCAQASLEINAWPAWAHRLNEWLTISQDWSQNAQKKNFQFPESQQFSFPVPIHIDHPIPFEEALLSGVYIARQSLFQSLDQRFTSNTLHPLSLLKESAYLAFERNLLNKLSKTACKTLFYEFSKSRPLGQNLISLISGIDNTANTREHYKSFIASLYQNGLLSLFQDYPVLARLLSIQIHHWIETTEEFLMRLSEDFPLISSQFLQLDVASNRQNDFEQIIQIAPALSDPHHQGRSVISIQFETGTQVIYKPKQMGLENAYTDLMSWLNNSSFPLMMKSLKVINRDDYGWVEFVEQRPCLDPQEAERYFQRAGVTACLLYLLNGTDCHYENLIAHGEYPVLIDLETLMHHETRYIEEEVLSDSAEMYAIQTLARSVLRTGLLPRWSFNQEKRIGYDISAFGSGADSQKKQQKIWININTDGMQLSLQTLTQAPTKNLPMLHGNILDPNQYIDHIKTGFMTTYQYLMDHQDIVLSKAGPLASFQAQPVRFVFRATKVYGYTWLNSLAPEFLRHGIDHSIELEILARAFVVAEEKPNDWNIFHSERRSLEQADIPYFGTQTDSKTLSSGLEMPLDDYFVEASFQQVQSRFKAMSQFDLEQQIAILEAAFASKVLPQSNSAIQDSQSILDISDLNSHNISDDTLINESTKIALEIKKRAIQVKSGSMSWIGLGYMQDSDSFELRALGHSLYDGSCGVALFLGALDFVKNSKEYHDTIYGSLHSLRNFFEDSDLDLQKQYAASIGIGGFTGLGSIIYTFARLSHLMNDDTLLDTANAVSELIDFEMIQTHEKCDLLAGLAGTILALLSLYNRTHNGRLVDKAKACGQRLLELQIKTGDRSVAWATFEDKCLTGLSHGASGIAYALLKLYEVTLVNDFRIAAEASMLYEKNVFSSEAKNWPDFRRPTRIGGQQSYMTSWCHGAPGIGLARLGAYTILGNKDYLEEVELAIETTQQFGLNVVDSLCCGNFGRIDVLLTAHETLEQSMQSNIARQYAALLVQQAKQYASYQLFANLPRSVFSPSFFQGYSGIGYSLLRLAYPNRLPSVLLLEV